ncbi:hypothetical protein [Actinophytocola sp. KF-1]
MDIGDDPHDERRELLPHRCFVRGPLPPDEHDRYPYDDRLTVATSAWPE